MYTLPGDPWIPAARARWLRVVARSVLSVRDEASEILASILAARPADAWAALALPQVGAPLLAGDRVEGVTQLFVELARRRVLGKEGLWWPVRVRGLLCPPAGTALSFSPERVGLLFADGAVEVGNGEVWDFTGERAFLPMREGGWLALSDNNPLATIEAHPEKGGSALSLGEATPTEWVRRLDEARGIVRAALPELADEHRQLLATVIPVGGPMERSLSASYREAIGVVYVSLHPSPLKMAEALVHEVQHHKLNLLTFTDPILEDGGVTLHASPVRPDPRPLWGVLLALHAFVAVEALYRRVEPGGGRLAEVIAANREALAVLRDHARPTALGRRLLEELEAAVGR